MSAMARSFYAEAKVISNTKMKEELGVDLHYPTYFEGIPAQLAEEQIMNEWIPAVTMSQEEYPTPSKRICWLVNSGSVRAGPTHDLRMMAKQTQLYLGNLVDEVVPVSARHSDQVSAALLHGAPAILVEMRQRT